MGIYFFFLQCGMTCLSAKADTQEDVCIIPCQLEYHKLYFFFKAGYSFYYALPMSKSSSGSNFDQFVSVQLILQIKFSVP